MCKCGGGARNIWPHMERPYEIMILIHIGLNQTRELLCILGILDIVNVYIVKELNIPPSESAWLDRDALQDITL